MKCVVGKPKPGKICLAQMCPDNKRGRCNYDPVDDAKKNWDQGKSVA